MQLIPTQHSATMSSREVAELIEKRHDHIKVSAERLAAKGVIGTPATREFTHNGNTYTEYLLNKRDSLILVAQNCPEFTARIVDRWQELEAMHAPAFKVPTTLSGALRLAAEQAETIEAQQLQLAAQQPAVEFVERYTVADSGSKGFREVCKILKANESQFRAFLLDNKIMYRLSGVLTAYQNHIDADRFEVTTGEAHGHAFNACKFTPKGVTWVAGEWAKYGLV